MLPNNNYSVWATNSLSSIRYCTFCVSLVGFVMLLAGAIICGIAFTEVRPNVADENYERYIRSDLKRVMGPIMLAFGLLCIISGCVFFGISLFSASREQSKARKAMKYNEKGSREYLSSLTQDADKKMLSDV